MKESCQTRRMFGHNYAIQGTYEVTMAVAGRRPVFGRIVGTTKPGGEAPHLEPSALGKAVLNEEIPKIHRIYPMVDIWQVCLMPDHLHMIVRINAPLPEGKHLGIIIGAFKGGVSRAWWRLMDAGGNAGGNAAATGAATATGAAAETPHFSSNALTRSAASSTLRALRSSTSLAMSAIINS